jgi:hypothetical protein
MWIGTYDIGCCLDQIYIAMCIGKNVTGIFHENFDVLYERCDRKLNDKFEVIFGLVQMIEGDVMIKIEVICG